MSKLNFFLSMTWKELQSGASLLSNITLTLGTYVSLRRLIRLIKRNDKSGFNPLT